MGGRAISRKSTLVAAKILCCLGVFLLACNPSSSDDPLADAINIQEFNRHLAALSKDQWMGRDTGTPGYDSASSYIEKFIHSLELLPGGLQNSYKQPIKFQNSTLVENSLQLYIDQNKLITEVDYTMPAVSELESINIDAPLVFAGFGIDNPGLGYSDLDNIDLSGKVAMIIRGAPDSFGMVERAVTTSNEVSNKALQDRGALAVIRVIPESYHRVRSWPELVSRSKRPRLRHQSPENKQQSIPSLTMNYKCARDILEKAGKDYSVLMDSLLAGKPTSFGLDFNVQLSAIFNHNEITSHNLAGIIEGTDPKLKHEYMVMTAHLDHIGISQAVNGDSINNGTLDNASGSAALMIFAEAFKNMPPPKRSIMFLWVTAEEKGLLGSDYFAKYPTIEHMHIVANLNIDGIIGMIVETKDVIAYGYEHSNLSKSVDHAVAKLGMIVSPDPLPEQNIFVRSDQYSFVKNGIPALYVVSGRTASDPSQDGLQLFNDWLKYRYHKPSDDMDQPMSIPGIDKELKLNFLIANHIANREEPIAWNSNSFLFKMFAE